MSNITYSCPSGYSASGKITASTTCSKTKNGTVDSDIDIYYTCSLFDDEEYDTSSAATTACTNYCSNSSTKYYSEKSKCIGLE